MICDPKTGNLVNRASFIMDYFKTVLPDRFSFELIEGEIESNLKIIRWVAKYNKRLIFPSTSEVYGMTKDKIFNEYSTNLTVVIITITFLRFRTMFCYLITYSINYRRLNQSS